MVEKLIFQCGSCGAKLVVDKEMAKELPRYAEYSWYGKPTGELTADCFCGGTMTAYTNGANGAFVDDIRNATEEFERVIEIAYEAAQAAVDSEKT